MTDETIFTIYIHSYILKLCVRKVIHSKFKREFDAWFKKSWQAILGVKRSRILAIQILKVLNNKNPKYILMKEVFKRKVNSKFRLSIIAGKHFKVGLTFQSNFFYLLQWKSFKNYEKCFLFHLNTTFCVWFFKENVSHAILYGLTKFHCLAAFTSWDIVQYVYCNFFFPSLWRHRIWK